MIRIHHSSQSRSLRVVWLAEEIGLPYEVEHVEMFSPEMKRPEYLSIHPLGKVPAIEDDGFVLWETSAILSYLVARYSDGSLIPPPDTHLGALAAQWIVYGENPLTVILGEIAAHSGPIPESMRVPALVDRGRDIAPALVGVVERALARDDTPYILGDAFSAADIMLDFGLNIAQHLGYVDASRPHVRDYCARLSARPAYQRAMRV